MDKAIDRHKKFVAKELAKLQDSSDKVALKSLLNYHDIMTRNFQHERRVHLIITLFFAVLMLVSWAALSIVAVDSAELGVVLLPMGLLVLVLTVLEGFYIRYYYLLENRTQKLYKLTDDIYELMRRLP
jgi:hypothetical protein